MKRPRSAMAWVKLLGQGSMLGSAIKAKKWLNDFFIYSLGPRKVPPKRPGTGRLREGFAWYSRNLETQGFLPGIARSPALSLTPDLRIQRLSKFYTIKYEQHLIAYGTCGEHSWDYWLKIVRYFGQVVAYGRWSHMDRSYQQEEHITKKNNAKQILPTIKYIRGEHGR